MELEQLPRQQNVYLTGADTHPNTNLSVKDHRMLQHQVIKVRRIFLEYLIITQRVKQILKLER